MLVISNKMMRIISILITVLIIVACLPLSIAYAQNEITVYIDGKKMDFSQPPIVIEDRTLVPMREVFETLGAVIEWDSDTETVTAVRSEKTIILKINETNAYIDGKQQALDVPACLIDNKTMIPLRFVSEALGASVDWSEKSQSIYIFSGEKKTTPPVLPEIKPNTDEDFLETHPNGEIIADDSVLFSAQFSDTPDASYKIVDVEGMPFDKALEVEVTKKPEHTYDICFTMDPQCSVKTGDIIYISCYMRTLSSSADENSGSLSWVYEQRESPFKKAINYECVSVGEWQKYTRGYKFKLPDGSKDVVKMVLRVGYNPQVIQVADFKAVNYGDTIELSDIPETSFDHYEGMEKDAPWRAEADARIEQIRKGDYKITVKDENGAVVPDAEISVDMTEHEFDFGTVVWGAPNVSSDMNFFNTIKEHFNMVVPGNALKWVQFENSKQTAIDVVNWAYNNGLRVRGHALIWDSLSHMPVDMQAIETDREKALERTGTHISDEVGTFKGKISDWDVVNEAVLNLNLRTKYDEIIYTDWFKRAREADPDAKLYINETGIVGFESIRFGTFMSILEKMKAYNVDYDGIGVQGHFQTPCNPMDFYNQINTLAEFSGKPVKITEYSFNGDPEIQAYFSRDILTAMFSNENVNGFVMWGHYEGADGSAKNVPMYYSDWTLKPAGEQILYLMEEKWRTHQKGSTASDGSFNGRGFYGDYDVTVKSGSITQVDKIHIGKDQDNNFEIILGKPATGPVSIADIIASAPDPSPLPDNAWQLVKEYNFNDLISGKESEAGYLGGSNLKVGASILSDSKTAVSGNSLLLKGWANYCKAAVTDVFSDLDTSLSAAYKISYDITVNEESDIKEFVSYPVIVTAKANGDKTAISQIYNQNGDAFGSAQTVKQGEWTTLEMVYHVGDIKPDGIGFVMPSLTTDKNKCFINIDNIRIYKFNEDYIPE